MSQPAIRRAGVDDAPGISRVHVDSWRTTYAGIIPGDYLAGLSYETSEERWRSWIGSGEHGNLCVSETAHEGIVGFVSYGRSREDSFAGYEGELYAIYLLKKHQQRGIGKSLFEAAKRELLERNISSMSLWVLTRNPSRRFYEILGGDLLGKRGFEIGGVKLEETAYGWTDTREHSVES